MGIGLHYLTVKINNESEYYIYTLLYHKANIFWACGSQVVLEKKYMLKFYYSVRRGTIILAWSWRKKRM
jgi:hypothetical protein